MCVDEGMIKRRGLTHMGGGMYGAGLGEELSALGGGGTAMDTGGC